MTPGGRRIVLVAVVLLCTAGVFGEALYQMSVGAPSRGDQTEMYLNDASSVVAGTHAGGVDVVVVNHNTTERSYSWKVRSGDEVLEEGTSEVAAGGQTVISITVDGVGREWIEFDVDGLDAQLRWRAGVGP